MPQPPPVADDSLIPRTSVWLAELRPHAQPCSQGIPRRYRAIKNLFGLGSFAFCTISIFPRCKNQGLNLTPKQMQACHSNSFLLNWTHPTQLRTPECHINRTHKTSAKLSIQRNYKTQHSYTTAVQKGKGDFPYLSDSNKHSWVLTTGQALF